MREIRMSGSVGAPGERSSGATRHERIGTLSGSRRVSLSGWRINSSRANSVSVGSSLAPLVVNAARCGEGLGLDREDDEEVMLEERGDDRPLAELDANGDGSATKPGAEFAGPVTEGGWGTGNDGALALGGAGRAEADVVLPVCPVDADERGERNGFLHGGPRVQ
jgi:hypothetical protein